MGRIAGRHARRPLLERGLRAAALAAALMAAPLLAGNASAQRTGAIQATAYVIPSYLGAGLRPDSTGTPAHPSPRPVARRLQIAGVGLLEIQTGAGDEVPCATRVVDRRDSAALAIQIFYVGT